MNAHTLADICAAAGGTLVAGSPSLSVNRICTDTRGLTPGALFIALRGERFDAHDYLRQANTAGAVAAIVDRDNVDAPPSLALIRVTDTRKALGQIGAYLRTKLNGTVIAIGGSNGKTSTKHLAHAALQPALRGTASPKSFNNDIGVPLTIADASPSDDYLVLELGTNHPGELRPLSHMARPNIAAITSVSIEHLEGLGDLEGVIREEVEIVTGLDPAGTLIVNGDMPELIEACQPFPQRKITFGFGSHNDLRATNVACDQTGTRFKINGDGPLYFAPMLGRHTASNAIVAITIARLLDVSSDLIAKGLATATGPEMRLQLQHIGPLLLLNDAYNANPGSMIAALQTMRDIPTTGRRIAVLGEMRELGHASAELHRTLGRDLAAYPIHHLVAIGAEARHLVDGARAAQMPMNRISHFADANEAAPFVAKLARDGDLILLKGSRGIQLERIAKSLQDTFT